MSISPENQKLAADILAALSGNDTPVKHPGEPPPADAPAASQERYAKAMSDYNGALLDLSPKEFQKTTGTQRRDLMRAALDAMGIDWRK